MRRHTALKTLTLTVLVAVGMARGVFAIDYVVDVAGKPNVAGFKGDGGLATSANLNGPLLIAHDSTGSLYISDTSNHRVRRIDALNGVITTYAGNGTAGFSGDSGPATAAQLNRPVGLCFDASNNLYISDQANNRIRKVTPTGTITTICGTGSGTSGADGMATTVSIATPGSIAFDSSGLGAVVFGELNGYRIRRVDFSTGMATTYVGVGTDGFSGEGGFANAAQIGSMSGMTFDASGNFYFIDAENQRIRIRDTSGHINTIAGTGTAGYFDSAGLAAKFNFYTTGAPAGGLFMDASNNLFICDSYNNLIRKLASGNVTTICGTGVHGYNGTVIDDTTAQLGAPEGVDMVSGKLYFVDTDNDLVRAIAFNSNPVTINSVTVTDAAGNPVTSTLTGTALTFTAAATSAATAPITYTWDFGDGSAPISGNPVTHAYSIEGTFSAVVSASNGQLSATQSVSITTLAPNSGGQGVPNLSQGLTEIINPIDKIGISVINSNGGVIQLNIDTDNVPNVVNLLTQFVDVNSTSLSSGSSTPLFKAKTFGVFVATATATDAANNPMKGRKTIVVGAAEVGTALTLTAMPKSQTLSKLSLAGKFNFAAGDSRALIPLAGSSFDTVSFSGVVELPAGLDLSQGQTVDFGIGNILDSVTVSAKGKATLPSDNSLVKKFQIKFPKLSKGATTTTAGQLATISLTIGGPGFSASGFDTEGVTSKLATGEPAKKPVNRTIQVAFVLGGVAYQVRVPVLFKLGTNGTSGAIGGRSSAGSL